MLTDCSYLYHFCPDSLLCPSLILILILSLLPFSYPFAHTDTHALLLLTLPLLYSLFSSPSLSLLLVSYPSAHTDTHALCDGVDSRHIHTHLPPRENPPSLRSRRLHCTLHLHRSLVMISFLFILNMCLCVLMLY